MSKKIMIEWFTPEEKKPEDNDMVIAVVPSCIDNRPLYVASLYTYKGHFNCSNDDLTTEIFPVYWAYNSFFEELEDGERIQPE